MKCKTIGLICAFVVVIIIIIIIIVSHTTDSFDNKKHFLRQKTNPFDWGRYSISQPTSSTYQYPESVTTFLPNKGAAMNYYFTTRNPTFD